MLRWIKRIVFGLVVLVSLVVVGGIVFVSTGYGRDKLRGEIEMQLAAQFAGGATIGKVEGTPFGELVLRDVVIAGPDHKPAITVGTLRVRIRLMDLFRHDVQLREVIAEDIDAHVVPGLLKAKPASTEPDSPSQWSIDLPSLEIRRAHVVVDAPRLGTVNLDGLALTASAQILASGVKTAKLDLTATWRERAATVSLATSVRDTAELLAVPSLALRVGTATLDGSDLQLAIREGKLPLAGGRLRLSLPAAMAPELQLPGDVTLTIAATRDVHSALSLAGSIGAARVSLNAIADLDTERAIGMLSTGELDLAQLTRGKIAATGGAVVTFDAGRDAATIGVIGHGTYEQLPRADFVANVAMIGSKITTQLDVTGAASASVRAELARTAESIALVSSSIVASTPDPSIASGGKAPVHGRIAIDLKAHGQLSPVPRLAVAGTVAGRTLRMQDLSVANANLSLDVTDLPAHPHGKLGVELTDIHRGTMDIPLVRATAATRADDRVAVDISSHPEQGPWLLELGALVTLPTADGTIVVDLDRDRIRAGTGVDWVGKTGHIVVGPEKITIRDLRSASPEGKVAIAGSFGRKTGDLAATVEVEGFTLATLGRGYLGTVGAHVDVARATGRWSGDVDMKAVGIVIDGKPPIDASAEIVAKPGSVTVAVDAANHELGGVKLALDLAAPAKLEDLAAWKARGRDAIRSARIALDHVDLAKVAALADQKASGQLDGELDITPTGVSGGLHVHHLQSPRLRGVKSIDADLVLVQQGDELDPRLTIAFADIGKIVASAQIELPKQPLDRHAWTPKLLHAALVQTDKIVLDPALFDRLGIASTIRGTAALKIEVAPGATSLTVTGDFDQIRGTPIAKPVDIAVGLTADAKTVTATVAMSTEGKPVSLLELDGSIPISLEKLRADPAALKTAPLTLAIDLPNTSAPLLLNVFGRPEVTAGTLDGKITAGGTIEKPTVTAHVIAHGLAMPPGPGGKPVHTIEQIALDGSWDPASGGKLSIDGNEAGGGTLAIRAQGDPRQLAAATATVVSKKFDFTPLLAFAPGPAGGARGTLDANLAVTGFTPAARLTGELHIRDARIPLAPTIGTLRDANIDIAIHPHDITLATTGKLGAGDVKMSGTIALDGASLDGGNAKITLRKVSPIGTIQPVISADITAKVARSNGTWTADIVIDHGFVKVSTQSSEKIKPVGDPSDLVIGQGKQAKRATAASAPPTAPFLVAKVTLHDTAVESDEFRTTIRGAITATADASAIGMTGSIESLGGDLDLFDRRYRIEEAAVRFDGSLDPTLQVRITHDFTDVTTVTEVRGRLSKPELEMSSDPGTYTKSQLLGFLLGGEPGGDPNSGSARDKATDAGTSFIAGRIGGYIKKALPFDIDVIRYEAASVSSSAAITVGSWVTHTLFFAFSQHLDPRPDENSGEATVEYWLTKRLEIEGTAGDRSVDGLDLLWRKRF